MNDSNKFYIIKYISEKDKYGFEETNKDNLDDFRDKYYKVDNLAKPIKTMSAYKTQELVDICNKLGIETTSSSPSSSASSSSVNKTKSKKDLYEAIIKYF